MLQHCSVCHKSRNIRFFLHVHDLVPLMDNCITITPDILNSNYIISEHTYIMDLYIRDCAVCLYCTGYTVPSCYNFSSTGVLNLMYLWILLFAHSNIFRDSIQFNSIQFNSIQFNSIQFNSIQFNSIQFNSIQFNTVYKILAKLEDAFWGFWGQRVNLKNVYYCFNFKSYMCRFIGFPMIYCVFLYLY